MKKYILMFGVLIAAIFVNQPVNGKTLFLAHYNQGLDADYAAGNPKAMEAAECGATITKDKKGYPFQDSAPSSEAVDLGYSTDTPVQLMYEANGNFNITEGTVETWVKLKWDWDPLKIRPEEFSPLFFSVPLQGSRESANLYLYLYNHPGGCSVAFDIYDEKENHWLGHQVSRTEKGAKKSELLGKWDKDTWHHLACTWTTDKSRLFVDGELVAEKKWTEKPIEWSAPRDYIYIGSHCTGKKVMGVLIDELRISDVALASFKLENKEHPAAPAAKGGEKK
ncbi:MAG: LamG domain-containing protein [Verrucomicrobia bacterium]|nr:LamG domain-containing protein [Verrucomicrobiota bacterium]